MVLLFGRECIRVVPLQMEVLVRYGAEVGLCNKDGWNAFHIAARSGNPDILQFLHDINPALICKLES